MSEVEFDNENIDSIQGSHTQYSPFQVSRQGPQAVTWLIKRGVAKNENQANYILLGVFIISVFISVFLTIYALHDSSQNNARELKLKKLEGASTQNV